MILMCLLQEMHKVQQGRQRTNVIALAAPLFDELWVQSVFLGTACSHNLKATTFPVGRL